MKRGRAGWSEQEETGIASKDQAAASSREKEDRLSQRERSGGGGIRETVTSGEQQ